MFCQEKKGTVMAKNDNLRWHHVLALDELPEGRVKSAIAGHRLVVPMAA
ncbi:MAG: hypothetical protein ACE5I1_27445 [bacterium]